MSFLAINDFYKNQPTLTCALLTLLFAIIILWIISRVKFGVPGKKTVPPGPCAIISMLQYAFRSRNETKSSYFERLSHKYGKIFGVYVGIRYTVVVTDYEMIREMSNMDALTPRPPKVFELNSETQHFAEMSGNEWREQRRLFLKSLRSLGMGKSEGELAIQEQIRIFLNCLDEEVGRDSVEIRKVIVPNVTKTILRLIFNETFEGNKVINEFMNDSTQYFFEKSEWFYFPWLKMTAYFNGTKKKFAANIQQFIKITREVIQRHENTFIEGERRDYIDFYLEEMKDKSRKTFFNRETLLGNLQIVTLAGSELIRSSLEWCIMCLVDYGDVQERVYREIIDLIGKERMPEWNDRMNLPFTQAVILEVLRWKDMIAVNDPRWTTENVEFRNWIIPKKSVILWNFHSVHVDPEIWGDPLNFRPERFLTADGKGIDNKTAERVLVFSLGKRSCPGERLASVQIFLYFASMIQRFRILPSKTGSNAFTSHFAPVLVNPLLVLEKRE